MLSLHSRCWSAVSKFFCCKIAQSLLRTTHPGCICGRETYTLKGLNVTKKRASRVTALAPYCTHSWGLGAIASINWLLATFCGVDTTLELMPTPMRMPIITAAATIANVKWLAHGCDCDRPGEWIFCFMLRHASQQIAPFGTPKLGLSAWLISLLPL